MRGGKPTPIQPGTAQPGDTPYDEVGERQRAGQNALPPDQASQARADILSAAKALRTHKGLGSYTGTRFNLSHGLGWYDDPIAGTDAAGAKSLHDNLTALLALPNLEKLRGPLSDKDIEFIKAASSKLQKNMPDEAFAAELDGIIQKLEAGGSLPASPGGGGAAPRPEDSALSELERRRRARGGR